MIAKPPFVIGHRGACGHAPENTLGSIRKAAELGARWVEFDAMLSADDEIILFHDDALERITGRDGLTAETSFDVLRTLDAGSWFSHDFAAERIPTLMEAFTVLGELGLGAVVEIKPSDGRGVETGSLVAAAVRDHWPSHLPDPIISSFNEDGLAQALDHAPEIPRALNLYKSLDGWQDKMVTYDCVALHCLESLLNEADVAKIVRTGYDLRCFTVNEPARASELRSWGVASVFTDFPERI
jgi:glycerophosphoryl diester phosphodiesterase